MDCPPVSRSAIAEEGTSPWTSVDRTPGEAKFVVCSSLVPFTTFSSFGFSGLCFSPAFSACMMVSLLIPLLSNAARSSAWSSVTTAIAFWSDGVHLRGSPDFAYQSIIQLHLAKRCCLFVSLPISTADRSELEDGNAKTNDRNNSSTDAMPQMERMD